MILHVMDTSANIKPCHLIINIQCLFPKSSLTQAIIWYFHLYTLHAGPYQVLFLIRQKFWIPDSISTVKKELRKCIHCICQSAQALTQLMGDLASSWVNPCRDFQLTVIAFVGPITTKCQHNGSLLPLNHICLFICLCTKAVHIELVSELTREAFLLTLWHFISR